MSKSFFIFLANGSFLSANEGKEVVSEGLKIKTLKPFFKTQGFLVFSPNWLFLKQLCNILSFFCCYI
jgi:hypothetical protein